MSPLTAGMNHWLVAGEQMETEVRTTWDLLKPEPSLLSLPKSTSFQTWSKKGWAKVAPPFPRIRDFSPFSISVSALYPSHLPNPVTSEGPSKQPVITLLLIKVVLISRKSLTKIIYQLLGMCPLTSFPHCSVGHRKESSNIQNTLLVAPCSSSPGADGCISKWLKEQLL